MSNSQQWKTLKGVTGALVVSLHRAKEKIDNMDELENQFAAFYRADREFREYVLGKDLMVSLDNMDDDYLVYQYLIDSQKAIREFPINLAIVVKTLGKRKTLSERKAKQYGQSLTCAMVCLKTLEKLMK